MAHFDKNLNNNTIISLNDCSFSAKSRKCCVWICQITSEAFLEEEDLLHYIGRIESTVSKSGKMHRSTVGPYYK